MEANAKTCSAVIGEDKRSMIFTECAREETNISYLKKAEMENFLMEYWPN
jgi:hypothetical protein